MIDQIKRQLEELKSSPDIKPADYLKGEALYRDGNCQILSQAMQAWDVLITDEDEEETEVKIRTGEDQRFFLDGGKTEGWESKAIAALMQIKEDLENTEPRIQTEGKVYTREGMVKRVLAERREKAAKAVYKIKFADNIYGEHILTNEKGNRYMVTLRDFKNETGYIDNPDLKTNKLGTTKHIMYVFEALKSKPRTYNRLSKTYPFVEIYLDPLNEYRITWHYPHKLPPKTAALIKKHFGDKNFIEPENVKDFLLFIRDATTISRIKIRTEVEEMVQKAWEQEMLETVAKDEPLDFSLLKAPLFPYQQEGVRFAAFRDGAIIADEMGLGKTIQAIATAVMKKKLFDFEKCLIICPASLKEQWKKEIEKFCFEEAVIVEGIPEQRREIYRDSTAYFIIANYETVLRDVTEMNRMQPGFIILDEAQRIKNFSTITAQNIKKLEKKHALVITGTPIENKITDLYSVTQFVDPRFLAPLWEFSYQHCYFDESKKDKITGYYNLQQLKERLKPILIRREKRKVIKELPQITELTVPVNMHSAQADYHDSFALGVAKILRKKYLSPFDLQRLMLLLNNMRMVCNSSYLIDKETYHSPKLDELKYILTEKLDVHHKDSKIIIFSEWVTMLNLIGKMLRENHIGYAQLSGKVAVKNRGKLVQKFETDPNCKVFLSSEAGGSGLNLQVADTVINFELPWNPAKKNQRIGRIDRLGQRAKQLTVINLITRNSFETKIASGLTLKQNLFDGILSTDKGPDVVDFSASGKAQFLRELEALMEEMLHAKIADEELDTTLSTMQEADLEEVISEEDNEENLAGATEEMPVSAGVASQKQEGSGTEAMETILNHGMEFLSGLLKMTTGKEVGLENKKVEIDKETGEIVMRFKLPGL
ncbi:MAG TPA: DEAD/DEAH box helicase [Chitinophagaceae bacterium]|nr:DEAD/DEAH box helicase [Chitinophagaceae bacterium]